MKSMPRSSERSRMAWAVGFVDLLAEGHGAEADRGDAQVALTELDFLHGRNATVVPRLDCATCRAPDCAPVRVLRRTARPAVLPYHRCDVPSPPPLPSANSSPSATCATTCASGASRRRRARRWCCCTAGWTSARSCQFVVDALAEERYVLAPDWRGFGLTDGGGVDNYWFPDYLADLDWLLDHYAGDAPVDLVGHSMGGNVAMQYARRAAAAHPPAGQPRRLRHAAARARRRRPARYGQVARRAEAPAPRRDGAGELRRADGVARRLHEDQPAPRARTRPTGWPRHWSAPRPHADGGERWEILGDPAHKIINAHIFRVDEALALYAAHHRAGAGGRGLRRQPRQAGGRAATPWPSSTSG